MKMSVPLCCHLHFRCWPVASQGSLKPKFKDGQYSLPPFTSSLLSKLPCKKLVICGGDVWSCPVNVNVHKLIVKIAISTVKLFAFLNNCEERCK